MIRTGLTLAKPVKSTETAKRHLDAPVEMPSSDDAAKALLVDLGYTDRLTVHGVDADRIYIEHDDLATTVVFIDEGDGGVRIRDIEGWEVEKTEQPAA